MPCFYLNNRVFLSRNYRLIVALRKFDVLIQYLPKKRSFDGKYASFKNIKFPRGNYQTDSSHWDVNTLMSLLFTTKFSSAHLNRIIFKFLRWKPLKPNEKFEKENKTNLLHTILIVHFLQTSLFTEKNFLWTTAIHLGIFGGWALWADSVSPRMNTCHMISCKLHLNPCSPIWGVRVQPFYH